MAAVFPTDTEARVAVIEAAVYLGKVGFLFSIEDAEKVDYRQ
jgi:hypothetical protein